MKNIKEYEKLNIINHSCAHLLAQAVKHLYPEAKFWVGPVIEDGFYYDIDLGDIAIKEEDLPAIEREMKKISKDGKRIIRDELSKAEALTRFKDDPYKIDLISRMDESENTISIYTQGDFTDLCRGPHVETVKELKFFKLLKVSGAYWKGDAKNKMLQRIYGVCFSTEEELNDYLIMLEEAKKRDHKKLGKDLELFFFDETAPGMPYWMPKGLKLFNTLVDFWRREHEKRGYLEFSGPQLNKSILWKTSGHWDHYREDMFVLEDVDGSEQALKPMNCPNSILMYKSNLRSYKDLPLRFSDVDVLHRNEASGALNGLFRVRMFRQDDSHNFITKEQIFDEINNILEIVEYFYQVFGIEYTLTLSTRPEDYMGDIKDWNQAELDLKRVLNERLGEGNYIINEGDGAFYGPKIDIMIKDALNRPWQCGTIQLDFQLGQKFDLSYVDNNGEKITPVIIHRVVYGSLERFIGILTEHFSGAFPLWLAPVQVNIIPVNNDYHLDYAKTVKEALNASDIRVELDTRDEKLGYKIRESQTMKIPYTLVIGDNEKNDGTITYRIYGTEEQITIPINEFISGLNANIKAKKIDYYL